MNLVMRNLYDMSFDVEPLNFSFSFCDFALLSPPLFISIPEIAWFLFPFLFKKKILVISYRKLCKDMFKAWSNLDDSRFVVEKISGGITNLC